MTTISQVLERRLLAGLHSFGRDKQMSGGDEYCYVRSSAALRIRKRHESSFAQLWIMNIYSVVAR